MKKRITALVFSLATLIPAIIYADQVIPQGPQGIDPSQVDSSQVPVQVMDEPQVTIIVIPEQAASPDEVDEDSSALTEGDVEELSETGEPTFDIPVTFNEKVEAHIHYFTDRIREKFSEWLARSERYLPMMKKTFKEKGLPEDLTYIALIESGFNNKAYSRAKAAGQWQFIKGTGKKYGLRIDRWIDERRDPEKATEAAAEYLSDLYAMFNDWYLAAAGYNAGEGKIIRAINRYDTNDFWELSQPKYRYLRRETKNYIPKLIAATVIAKEPAKYGFDNIEYHPPLTYEKVVLNGMKDLRDIASVSECGLEDLKSLNPELKTNFTPPNYPDYQLKVPVGKKEVVESRAASIKTVQERVALKEVGPEKKVRKYNGKKRVSQKRMVSYIVRKGDTLHEIAARYKVPMEHLISWNNLWGKTLQAGNRLKIYVERGSDRSKRLS